MTAGKWSYREIVNLIALSKLDMTIGDLSIALDRSANGTYAKLMQLRKGLVIDSVFIQYPFSPKECSE